jgi:predicted metalloendopeptidase
MGMVMGHEISHGFDDEGRKYNAVGELQEWWSPEVSEKFEEAAQCIVEQYSQYEPVAGHPINGELTLGENIADNGGVKQSFAAYKAWVAEHGAEPEVAGLTGEQLFFVSAGQAWCSKWTEELTLERIETDPHSFPRFRVIGAMQNFPEFGKAFDCKPGDPMMPKDHCTVW